MSSCKTRALLTNTLRCTMAVLCFLTAACEPEPAVKKEEPIVEPTPVDPVDPVMEVDPVINVPKSEYSVGSENQTLDIEYESDSDCTVTIASESSSWLKISSSKATTKYTVTLSIDQNKGSDRTGTLTISSGKTSKTVTILQGHTFITFQDEAFNAYCIEVLDTDKNGGVTLSEIEGVTSLSPASRGIVSLEGLKTFTSLKSLDCSGNNLEFLDLRGIPTLKTLNAKSNPNLDSIYLDSSHDVKAFDSFEYDKSLTAILYGDPSIVGEWTCESFKMYDKDGGYLNSVDKDAGHIVFNEKGKVYSTDSTINALVGSLDYSVKEDVLRVTVDSSLLMAAIVSYVYMTYGVSLSIKDRDFDFTIKKITGMTVTLEINVSKFYPSAETAVIVGRRVNN